MTIPQPDTPAASSPSGDTSKRRATNQGGTERYGGHEEENERDRIDPPKRATAEQMARRKIAPLRKKRTEPSANPFAQVATPAPIAIAASTMENKPELQTKPDATEVKTEGTSTTKDAAVDQVYALAKADVAGPPPSMTKTEDQPSEDGNAPLSEPNDEAQSGRSGESKDEAAPHPTAEDTGPTANVESSEAAKESASKPEARVDQKDDSNEAKSVPLESKSTEAAEEQMPEQIVDQKESAAETTHELAPAQATEPPKEA